jgi:NTP pyrophosphatase (non-canonical NTP hydrolase)
VNWTKTKDALPRYYAPVLVDSSSHDLIYTPEGWKFRSNSKQQKPVPPTQWAYVPLPIYKEDQKTISSWGKDTFGVAKSPALLVKRAAEEMRELLEAVESAEKLKGIPQELADVMVVLLQAANDYNTDLLGAVEHKMQINRNRKWKITEDGVGQHV